MFHSVYSGCLIGFSTERGGHQNGIRHRGGQGKCGSSVMPDRINHGVLEAYSRLLKPGRSCNVVCQVGRTVMGDVVRRGVSFGWWTLSFVTPLSSCPSSSENSLLQVESPRSLHSPYQRRRRNLRSLQYRPPRNALISSSPVDGVGLRYLLL